MVDTRATHNFLANFMMVAMGLQVKGHPNKIEVMNSKANKYLA